MMLIEPGQLFITREYAYPADKISVEKVIKGCEPFEPHLDIEAYEFMCAKHRILMYLEKYKITVVTSELGGTENVYYCKFLCGNRVLYFHECEVPYFKPL